VNVQENKNLIIKYLRETKRQGIESLIEHLEKNGFFTSPASRKYHGNFEGGLAIHSLLTYDNLFNLNRILSTNLTKETMVISALLHDVCKMNTYKKSENGYEHDDTYPIGHSEKSIIILQRFIELTEQEIILIRWHMGPYDPSLSRNEKHLQKHYPYFKLLYYADDISANFCEEIIDGTI
jgi:hypothetical protein